MTEDYYELQANGSAWTHEFNQYKDRVNNAIITVVERLKLPRGSSVLDVGCGDGTSLKQWYIEGMVPLGFDISREKTQYARDKGLPVINFDIDYENFTVEKAMDLVFCSHTLEHTRDAIQASKNLCSLTKDWLVIIVPLEESFPENNPSHTQHMNSERIRQVKETIEKEGFFVILDYQHHLEDEVWFWCQKVNS